MNRQRHRPCLPEMFCPACAKRCPKSMVPVHLHSSLPLSDRQRSRSPRENQSEIAANSHWVLEPVQLAGRIRWLKQQPCQLKSYRIGAVSDLSCKSMLTWMPTIKTDRNCQLRGKPLILELANCIVTVVS